MNDAARNIDQIASFEGEGEAGVLPYNTLLFLFHVVGSARQPAAVVFDFPFLRAENLKDKDVVIVPMRREAFSLCRRQIAIGLKSVAKFALKNAAEMAELWFALVQLVQNQCRAAPHLR